MAISNERKQEALRLRIEERLSLERIADITKISQSTLSGLLKLYPLTDEEKRDRMALAGKQNGKQNGNFKFFNITDESDIKKISNEYIYSSNEKGAIAEAATAFRLVIRKYILYSSNFDGSKFDLLVQNHHGKLLKIQVKWMQQGKYGAPSISLCCANGRHGLRKYQEGEFDIIVGYDINQDKCYVYTFIEVANHKKAIHCTIEAEEAWDKLEIS